MKHVQVPSNFNLKELGLKPKDLLVYCNIKSYENSETKTAFPCIDTISKNLGYSSKTIKNSINNLEQAKLIKVYSRPGKSNLYEFLPYDKFEIFSKEFLDKTNLTEDEKAYIISIQSRLYKDNNSRLGITSYSNIELSKMINLDRGTISKLDKSLEEKGLLNTIELKKKDETGIHIKGKFFHLDELGQAIIFELLNHSKKLNDHDKEISDMKKKIDFLLKELNASKEIIKKHEEENHNELIL